MRYYVIRCGYWCELRFQNANEAGRLLASMAAHVQMGEDGSDHTSFELVVHDEPESEEQDEPETEEPDPEIVRPGELVLPFEEVSDDDNL